jgi:hypothetical protein
MPRPKTEDRLADIHADALIEFDQIQQAQREQREQSLADRRFYLISGAQYEGDLGEQFANRPKFEINRTHLAVLRIINEYRNNRITVDFTSKDGSEGDQLADTCDGLYRADEKASGREAYDNAFEEAAGGGMGAWRVRACYEDEDDEDNSKQRCRLEPIHDADSRVFFNLDATAQDKSDAKRCYVLTPYTRDAYEAEFGDDPAPWQKGITNQYFDWCTPDVIWVCELYKIEEAKEMVYWFRGLALSNDEESLLRVTQKELDAEPDKRSSLEARGFRVERQKRVKVRKVHKYLMSGARVLEEEDIAGTEIPVVVTYGKRAVIDGVERFMGHVRLAKDAQRLTNMLMSWLAEIASSFSVETPIFAPEQMVGLAQQWADHNIERFSHLLAHPLRNADGSIAQTGPIGYTKAPNVPPAMGALLQIATEALNDLLGGQQAGEQLQPNLSGKAVELIQNRLDMQVFIYMDNFGQYGMRRSGQIWLSMMRDIVVENSRRMKIVATDGKSGSVVVNEPQVDKNGKQYIENDISKATFDVDVDVGPSSSSKRATAVRAMSGLSSITQDPEMQQAINLVIAQNIEGEGMDDFNAWARKKSIRMGITKPNDEEKAELEQEKANQQPDPQAAYLLAEAKKAQADVALKEAQTEKARADAAAVVAGIGSDQVDQAIAIADALAPPTA